jgi:hypothetical protein
MDERLQIIFTRRSIRQYTSHETQDPPFVPFAHIRVIRVHVFTWIKQPGGCRLGWR